MTRLRTVPVSCQYRPTSHTPVATLRTSRLPVKRPGLTQEQFQKLLGVGETSVSRWETGRIPQLKLADDLMRAIECIPRVTEMLAEKSEVRIASENAAG